MVLVQLVTIAGLDSLLGFLHIAIFQEEIPAEIS